MCCFCIIWVRVGVVGFISEIFCFCIYVVSMWVCGFWLGVLRLRVWGLESGVGGLGFGVWTSVFRAWGLRSRACDFGFVVWGFCVGVLLLAVGAWGMGFGLGDPWFVGCLMGCLVPVF